MSKKQGFSFYSDAELEIIREAIKLFKPGSHHTLPYIKAQYKKLAIAWRGDACVTSKMYATRIKMGKAGSLDPKVVTIAAVPLSNEVRVPWVAVRVEGNELIFSY